ncbi:hypothetical protein SAMN04489868_1872 [Pisciglobus halotolerans]|uniref:Uncharacterized protein n=1 Tax=Pisciglobus halotolerans TaxID=745365 RepID=A0A1I3EAB3_9LACT|nr:hypothetical protein SAMN04489868_1872 [Pisciglobus halotolerans]
MEQKRLENTVINKGRLSVYMLVCSFFKREKACMCKIVLEMFFIFY